MKERAWRRAVAYVLQAGQVSAPEMLAPIDGQSKLKISPGDSLMKSRSSRRPVPERKLVVEPLESRIVLDGNVRAFVSGGSLHLQGDFHDNQILIEQSRSRSFTVSSRDGSTLINGQAGPLTFTGVRKDLDISMGKGN